MRRNAVSWAALVLAAGAFLSAQTSWRPLPAAREIPSAGQKTAKQLSEAFNAVAEFVKPSVVQISVERKSGIGRMTPRNGAPGQQREVPKEFEDMLKRFFGPDFEMQKQQFGGSSPKMQGTGSGFVYDDKGHIVTNHHVVDQTSKIIVRFHDGAEAEASVVGSDKDADVAVIKVKNTKYPALPKGESAKLHVGEWVLAVGSPFGLSQTVTSGIVSATERSEMAITAYNQFIQTDAAINPGNSGGPLVDMDGRVVGVNTAIVTQSASNAGIGFAIPIDFAAGVAEKILKSGKVEYARIGLILGPLTPPLAKQFGLEDNFKGLVVEEVVPASPGEKAGLRKGDVITSFDHATPSSPASFRMKVAMCDVGKTFDLGYVREGKEHHANVTLASASLVDARFSGGSDSQGPTSAEDDGFGLSVQDVTPEVAGQLGYPKDLKGVLVKEVKEGGAADDAGLQAGDVITQVVKNRSPKDVSSVKDFENLVGNSNEIAVFVKSPRGDGRFVGLSKHGK